MPAPFSSCSRFLSGHGPRKPAQALRDALALVSDDDTADIYGTGPIIEEFERDIARELGMPAAVFMPSGTMAQQIALRLHARPSNRRVALHATSHLELHEEGAARELHNLELVLMGTPSRLFTRADLEALPEEPSSILWELPQRELGGQLPEWNDLAQQLDWAKQRGIACHLDGARLWEAAPYYRKSHAEIANLFDSVYVSFYKGLGGIAGAALVGSEEFVKESRPWLRRHGGNLISLYPYVLSAKVGLERYRDAFGEYLERARSMAAELSKVDGIRVVPDVPQAPMMHLHIQRPADALNRANQALAAKQEVMLFGRARELEPHTSLIEIAVGSACASFTDPEVAELFRALLQAVEARA